MKNRVLVIGVGALLTVTASGCGSVPSSPTPPATAPSSASHSSPATSSSTRNNTGTSSSQSVATAPSSTRTSASTASVTLPVQIVTPTFGAGSESFSYPPEITTSVPVQWAGNLEAIGAAGFISLAPKGWIGQAAVGADGTRLVTIYPPNGSATTDPQITISTASACVGCAWYGAAPYFSWVRSHFSSAGWGTYSGPIIHGYAAAPDLRFYVAQNTSAGMRVNGIAFAPFINNSQSSVLFRKVQTVLPPGEHALATIVLNYLLNQITG